MSHVAMIEYWYDRILRLWTILLRDAEGNQIGNAEYEPRILEAKYTVGRLRKEYPKAKVVKY